MDDTTRYRISVPPADSLDRDDDDASAIRYSLTALGEIAVARGDRASRGPRFSGFGPCAAVA